MRLVSLTLLTLSVSMTAAADPVLDKMRNLSDEGPVYAYEMQYSDADITAVGRIDPSQPEGQRIELLSPDRSTLSEDVLEGIEEMDAEADGDIWCNDFAEMVPATAIPETEDEATVTYAFTPQPEADADKTEKKMMKKLNATITLDKSDGAILAYNMRLPKPYKPAMVAKINAFQMDVACARAPDGRTFVERFDFNISGSAMMQSFSESVSRQITQLLDPVG